MTIGPELSKILNKQYQPSDMVEAKFMRYDIAFKTDDTGRPILLFIGQKDEHGKIKGEWFARRLKLGSAGEVIKDHWDNKGKTL